MNAPTSVHPSDEALSSYGLGKLDDILAEAVNTHLEQCTDCRQRVAEMSADSFLGGIRSAQAGESPFGVSQTDGTQSSKASSAPPPIDTMPPGLADNADYEIKRELGRGGMGVVYLAHNKLMGRDEVLKVMGRQIMERPGVLDRFRREIRAVAKLRHPNIVTAYSAVRLGESIVFSMEYVDGLDLSRMVKAKGPLPVAHACNFVFQSALGLQHAHDEGLVHRDIKPGNLMLSRTKDKATIKILDFGLAKVTREEKVDGGLTHEGQALGTPDFIAPEQILDAATADIRADIYSLGCTLYYLLSGRPPFQASSLYDMFQAHISRDADLLNFIRSEVPAELAALVAKMMAKEPARRFQMPGEVAEALAPFFKKANAAFKRPELTVSQDSRNSDGQPALAVLHTPAQPASDYVQPQVRARKAAERAGAETRWDSLIDRGKAESSRDAAPVVAKSRRTRPPWVWAAVAGAAFLVLAVALGVIIKLRMEDVGLLIIEVSEPGAEITLDKRQAAITWDASRKRAEIKVLPGEHMVEVTKDGFTAKGMKVAVSEAGREIVKAFLQPADRDAAKPESKPVASELPVVPAKAPAALTERTTSYPVRVVWGVWGLSGSDVVVKRTGSHSAVELTKPVSLDDFTFEAEIRRIEGRGSVELNFGEEYYKTFGFYVKGNQETVFLRNFKQGRFLGGQDLKLLRPVDHDKWDHLRIEQKGKVLVYYVNHQELFRESNERISRGRFVAATVDANASFRNIKATGTGGSVLLEGLPNLPNMKEDEHKITVAEAKEVTLVPKDGAFLLQMDGATHQGPKFDKQDVLVIPLDSAVENVTVLDREDAQNPFLPRVQFNKGDVTISGNLTVAMGSTRAPKMYITPPELAQIQISHAKNRPNGAERQPLVLSIPDYIVDAEPDRVLYHFTDPGDPNVKHQKAVMVESGSAGIDFPSASDPDFFDTPQGKIALHVSGDPQTAVANMTQRLTNIMQNVASVLDPTKLSTTVGVALHQMGVDLYINSRPELNLDLTKEYDVETMPIKPIRIKEPSENKASGKPATIREPG